MTRPAGKRRTAMPLTEARARLFPLVDDLLAGRTDRVALSRRGADQEVLLVRARDLERMEAELAALRRRLAPEPRPLWGIAEADGEVEDILRELRREADAQLAARMTDIFGDVPTAAPADGGTSPAHAEPAGRVASAARRRRRA